MLSTFVMIVVGCRTFISDNELLTSKLAAWKPAIVYGGRAKYEFGSLTTLGCIRRMVSHIFGLSTGPHHLECFHSWQGYARRTCNIKSL